MFRYCFLFAVIVGLGYQSLDANSTHAYLNRANANVPNEATAYDNRGYAKQLLRDNQGARETLLLAQSDLSAQDYLRARAYYKAGLAKGQQGEYDEAIEDFNEAIRLNPNYAEAYYYRGEAKRRLEDYQGAIEDYTEAIRFNPNYAEAYYYRGLAKLELGEHKEAIQDYDKAIELNPNYALAYNDRGVC